MKIRAGEWQRLTREQRMVWLIIAYGYWRSRWEAKRKRKTPASAATDNGR
jgi:hypothetical protein